MFIGEFYSKSLLVETTAAPLYQDWYPTHSETPRPMRQSIAPSRFANVCFHLYSTDSDWSFSTLPSFDSAKRGCSWGSISTHFVFFTLQKYSELTAYNENVHTGRHKYDVIPENVHSVSPAHGYS